MATLTIRNVPDEVVARIKSRSRDRGTSMEEELRGLLQSVYRDREAFHRRVEASIQRQKGRPTAEEIDAWKRFGRP
jgi:plasmid stability protein